MKSLKQLDDEYPQPERILPDSDFEDFLNTTYEIGVAAPEPDTTLGGAQTEIPVQLKEQPLASE